jgi:hypothetical protein
MAVHFYCACGKHLKARRDMAGRVTLCPACGEHVKIPAEEPTHLVASRVVKADPLPTADADRRSRLPEVLIRGQSRSAQAVHREQPERGWMGSFVYTLPVLPWLVLLAAGLAITSAVVLDRLPASLRSNSRRPLELEIFIPCVLAIPLLLLCATPFLSGILAFGIDGSLQVVSRPRLDYFLRAAGQWLVCLAAGPVLLVAAAAGYWVHCGDMQAVDWLIVIELLALGSAILLASLVVTSSGGGVRRLHPFAILHVTRSLGWWFAGTSIVLAGIILGLAYLASFAAARLRDEPIITTLWLGVGWFAALAAMAFLFRRLGLWHYRAFRTELQSGNEGAGRKFEFERRNQRNELKPL